jgi:hypothetical protein
MKKLIDYCLAAVLLVIGASMITFAIGSFTGVHHIQYDDNGMWMCWTPDGHWEPDYPLSQDCWNILAWVPSSYVIEHKQGFVGCRDGSFVVANITFSGMVRKDVVKLINPDDFECTAHTMEELKAKQSRSQHDRND